MPIAELFLSTVVKTILTELSSRALTEYARINGISEKLKNWKLKLKSIQAVMDSAEERQKDGNSAIDLWLADLRDVAYDMEDLLDHFNVDAKLSAFKGQTRSSKFPSCLIACCSKIDPRTLLKDYRMADEIDEVDRRLDNVLRQKEILQLDENFRSSTLPANSSQPRFTTTSVPEPKFVGRERHMEELLQRLIRVQETQDSVGPFTVVSIVGMGGLGKTTLAQQLFNHESVSNAFKLKAWACVSAVFDIFAITKSVLQDVDPSSSYEGKGPNWLQTSLKQQLSEKKFLIVLDDVWTENYDELGSLFKPFYSGSSGSRILLTTRNRQVAKNAGDHNPKELDLMSTNDCLSLLAYHAIGKDSFNSFPHLENVAIKLAEMCKGLPLAVKTIGGLLRFESDDEKWKQVLDNGIWMGEGGQERIPPALKLSYVYLPIHLKRCFAACALFPKDYVFEGDELIQMWIVQGLLHKETAKTYRDVGFNYLGQLVDRSLLQKEGDKKTRYYMHDLINDLAKSVVGVTYFISHENRKPSNEETLANVRHAAMVVVHEEKILASKVGVYHLMKKLRTFIPFQTYTYRYSNVWVSKMVLHDLIMGMKHLRILSFRHFCIREVPDLFGELKLLRSLDFSYTDVEVLPESICDLVELQYLLLQGCYSLKKLPRNIHKLTNLLHLDISRTYNLKEMPPHIGSLTNLEILSSFVVGKEAGQELKELGKLKRLQRELHIHNLLKVNNVGDAKIANIHGKEGVSELSLDWGSNVGISSQDEHQLELLNHLQPPKKIESLGIHHYGGRKFPSWFGNSCMENVVSITLAGCESIESLPPFGRLPSLESLNISELHAVSMIGDEFYGTPKPFRSLKSLVFSYMRAWENWSSSGNCENDNPFPLLRMLTLENCFELKSGLPGRLDSLFELEIRNCPFLSASGGLLSLSSLGKLHFNNSNDGLLKCLVETTCMTYMSISNVPQLIRFDGRFSSSWVALEELRIEGCHQFKSFEDEYGREQVPPKLKKLEIINCADLERLPDDFRSLNEMTVSRCHNLSSFPSMGLPPALSKLEIEDCPGLSTSQFRSMRLLESLKELTISNLEGLMSIEDVIVGTRLSQSLRKLSISYCRSLKTIPDGLQHLSALSELHFWECEALEMDCFPALPCNLVAFALDSCPKVKSLSPDMHNLTSLKYLVINGCISLTTIPDSLQHLSALSELCVRNCEALEMGCFPALPCNLVHFELGSCPKVKSLHQDMYNLTSLKHLQIYSCDGIKCLPRGGLPPNLECLRVYSCHMMNQPLEEWGLAGLTSLREFTIGGEMGCVNEMVSFPSSSVDAWRRLLPSSLVVLHIWRMKKVERLSRGLRAHLSSLQMLCIFECVKMSELPEEGLPDSLEYLQIHECNLLKERCKKTNGDYWKLIQLIPRVQIDFLSVT